MNYAELAVMQASRAKTFSAAQTDAMAAYCQAEHDLKELQAENAKLRELVHDVWQYITTPCDDYCERCLLAEDCSERSDYDCCLKRDEFVGRLRELGIEVDG